MATQDNPTPEQPKADQPAEEQHKAMDAEKTENTVEADAEAGESPEQEAVSELEALQEELAAAKDQSLRIQAEMQNQRRRAERDVENAHKYALEKFVGDLLPVVDNLERAIAAIPADNDDNQAILEGVELTLKSFVGVLEKFAVKAVDPNGEAFDPELHQAMTMVPSPDHKPNTVIEVFQKGYTLNGRLVRPAMVVVAKAE